MDEATDDRADKFPIIYPLSGLATEGGECGAFVEKYLRMGAGQSSVDYLASSREKIILELGDIFYYFTKACNDLGISWIDVMVANVQKLEDRKLHGKR